MNTMSLSISYLVFRQGEYVTYITNVGMTKRMHDEIYDKYRTLLFYLICITSFKLR